MSWQEYNIRAGEQNFYPPEPLGLTSQRGFRFRVAFHHSCYYSWRDVDFDGDWYDVNKLCGLTLAYTPNNHLAYMAGFSPSNGFSRMLVSAYTNYPGSRFQYDRKKSLSIPTVGNIEEAEAEGHIIEGIVTRNSRNVFFALKAEGQREEVKHSFRLPWYLPWIGRRTGTWFGGDNNSPGDFGGRAHKPMKLWLQFETI